MANLPMIHVDLRTVVLLAGVMSGFMAVILYALKRSYPPAIKGLMEWAVALLLVALGSVLAFGVGYLPSLLSITLPRLLFPSGLFLTYLGMQRFFGVVPRLRPWVVLIAAVMVVQTWFTFVDPSFAVRLFLANCLAGCLFLAMGNLLRKQGLSSFSRMLTMSVVLAMLAILLMRVVTSFLFPVGRDIFDASPQQVIYVSSFSFLIVLLSVGLVLMAAERLHSEMSFLATHDSLTNALTRRHLNAVCAIELDRSQRHGRSMALLIMDLDYFKAVNDNHGHLRGDRVLVDFVATANRLLRRPDQLARFGGEEFVALLPETSLEEALGVAERIRQACAQPSPETACTVSIGVTTNHTAGDSVDTLIARADAAMYQAKAKGRNRVESA
jgi:diguanylate cyclase (GGDEF)-like protein